VNRADSAFRHFLGGGIQSNLSLSAMSVLSSLAVNLDRNAFDSSITSRSICSYIETLHDGVKAGLDILSPLFSSGEVLTLTSQVQVDVVYTIMLSTLATLLGVRSVMYLHDDPNVRIAALAVRDDIISTLASSTSLGQVIAYISTAPLTLSKSSFFHDLSRSVESTAAQQSNDDSSKYGAWDRFVTPKRRASKKAEKAANAGMGSEVGARESLSLSALSQTALALIIIWGGHVEDMFSGASDENVNENFLMYNPSNLLLSKAPSPASHSEHQWNVSNLNIISRFLKVEQEYLSILASKVIKMCIRQASIAAQSSLGDPMVVQTGISTAFADDGVFVLTTSLFRSLKKVTSKDYTVGMEQSSVLAVINLESISLSVIQQPEMARSILCGRSQKNGVKDFKLVDELVTTIESFVSILNAINRNETYDSRVFRIRCVVANGCLDVIIELWKCCRLGSLNSTDYHPCGGAVGHLIESSDSTNIAHLVVEVARSSLLAVTKQEDKNAMQDEIPILSIHEKNILLGVLSRSLSFLSVETIARKQTDPDKGINFINELTGSNPMECWLFLLTSNKSPVLASSYWNECKVTRRSIDAFCKACPAEASHTCSLDLAVRLAKVTPKHAQDDVGVSITKLIGFHNLALAETQYASDFACFFGAVIVSSLPEVSKVLINSLLDGVLDALTSISESKLTSQSLLLPNIPTSQMLKPFEDLSSLLLTLLSTRGEIETADRESLLQLLSRLLESSSRIFITTQYSSLETANEVRVIGRNTIIVSFLVCC
jgi:hypothetical protein